MVENFSMLKRRKEKEINMRIGNMNLMFISRMDILILCVLGLAAFAGFTGVVVAFVGFPGVKVNGADLAHIS